MSDFQTYSLTNTPLDPWKRVRYSQGLVLGVDEFLQEELYLTERDRLHQRALHGYGVVYGLEVYWNSSDRQVHVSPGLAVDAHGQDICISLEQCADLDAWLSRRAAEIVTDPQNPPHTLSAYVTLCYRQCETDKVPVPGEPCRTDVEGIVASRIADDFELKLTLQAPPQLEEDIVRRFGDLLGRFEIRADAASYLSRAAIEDLVRSLVDEPAPAWQARYYLRPQEACDLLHAAMLVWTSEVRPEFFAQHCGSPEGEGCVLLARLDFSLDYYNEIPRLYGDVSVDQDRRPILLHTRLLQEWLLCGRLGQAHDLTRTFASLYYPSPGVLRLWVHHPELLNIPAEAIHLHFDDGELQFSAIAQAADGVNVFDITLSEKIAAMLVPGSRLELMLESSAVTLMDVPAQSLFSRLDEVEYSYLDRRESILRVYLVIGMRRLDDLFDVDAPAPQDGQFLTFTSGEGDEGRWVAADLPVNFNEHGELSGLGDDDHTQYLLADGTRALGGDWSAGGFHIRRAAQAQFAGDVLPHGNPAAGDLSGSLPNPRVSGLQTHAVAEDKPNHADVLTWNEEKHQWEPRQPSAAGEMELTRIVAMSWRHQFFSNLEYFLNDEPVFGFVVGFGKAALHDSGAVIADTLHDMTFQAFIETTDEAGFLECKRIPARVIPVMPEIDDTTGLIHKASVADGRLAEGAAMVIDTKVQPLINQMVVRVLLRGDFVLDESGERAIDAEFVRAALPTGDRSAGAPAGIQGGLFESWVVASEGGIRDVIDVNTATVAELRTLPGIGETRAAAIIAAREALGGRFNTLNDILAAEGIGPSRLRDMTPFIRLGR
jgi:competence ComEA-like helix-hairpin-helix protein